ncbi:hypothetical protein [Paenibacillus sp. PK3_47]|nr:hypothetical protein [Paenibacillus sp. PK3_47]
MSKYRRSDKVIVSTLLTVASLFIIAFYVIRYIVQNYSFAP